MRQHWVITALLATAAAVPAAAQRPPQQYDDGVTEPRHQRGNEGEQAEQRRRERSEVQGAGALGDRGAIGHRHDDGRIAQAQAPDPTIAVPVGQPAMSGGRFEERRGGRGGGEWRQGRETVDPAIAAQAREGWHQRHGEDRDGFRRDGFPRDGFPREGDRRDRERWGGAASRGQVLGSHWGTRQWGGQQYGGQRYEDRYRYGQQSPFGRNGGTGYYRQPYQGGYREGGREHGGWDRDWRRDQRYDWQRYRYANRGLFQPGRYYPPRGYEYGYNRFSIGVVLGSAFFGSNYWINDPYAYRLPSAYAPYRWVRYYNDVLLIDTRNGYVVDVINDFFY